MIRKLILLGVLLGALFGLAGAAALSAAPAMASTTCTAGVGSQCGPYGDLAFWPGSNGYNTYVADQAVNVQPGGTGSVTATDPSNWTAKANYTPCGGCVQTFTAVQQLTNNWNAAAKNFTGSANFPLSAASKLQVKYTESTPSGSGNQYEFAPDIWTNYGHGNDDIMLWADTSPGRCTGSGFNSSMIIGQVPEGTQNWTAYAYGGKGGELIFILDGSSSTDPAATGTCAQQKSGTIPALSLLHWVANHASVTGSPPWSSLILTQLNTGYEITAGDGVGQYQVSSLQYPLVLK